MNKVNGTQASYAPVREDGSRIAICYGLKKLSKDLYEWFEVYLPKKQMPQLTFDVVKQAIINDIDERVKAQIIGGMTWNGKPVWYSIENQLNFTNATAPVTLKIGEQEDGTPVYYDFENSEQLTDFRTACNNHKQAALSAGWQEKDGINWEPYQKFFGTTEE
jgi:hypothetical protein